MAEFSIQSVSDKYQTFTVNPAAVAMAHGENRELWIHSQMETVAGTHWAVVRFPLKVNVELEDDLSDFIIGQKLHRLPRHYTESLCRIDQSANVWLIWQLQLLDNYKHL